MTRRSGASIASLAAFCASLGCGCSGSGEGGTKGSLGIGTGKNAAAPAEDEAPPYPEVCVPLAGLYRLELAEVQACDPAEEDPCIGGGVLVDGCACPTAVNKSAAASLPALKAVLDLLRETEPCYISQLVCQRPCPVVTTAACIASDESDPSVGVCGWAPL